MKKIGVGIAVMPFAHSPFLQRLKTVSCRTILYLAKCFVIPLFSTPLGAEQI